VTSRSRSIRQRSSFSRLVTASVVPHTRRDFMRASAILTGAAATGIQPVSAHALSTSTLVGLMQDDIETGVEIAIPFNPYGQDVTLDPHRAPNWGPFWVMLPYAWSGLLRFNENGGVEPDLAESVTPKSDGSVWTAVLKEGIAYANGDPVLADHFVGSWKRALDPLQLSPMAQFMEPVKGFSETEAGGEAELGFSIIDDRTIEITLTRPVSHFPSSLATFVWAVMHPAYIDQVSESAFPLQDAGAGPWKITEFDEGNRVVMTPNEHYWGSPSPSVTSIAWQILPSGGADQAALDLYAQDLAVVADVPHSLLPGVREDGTLSTELVEIEDHASTLAVSMDFHQPPFNDVRVRRAIASAIDTGRWATDIVGGSYVPARSFTPPVLRTIANYTAPEGLTSSAEGPANLPDDADLESEIFYFQPATDTPEQMESARQLVGMIEEATGIAITHDTSLTPEQITALRQDNGGLQFNIVQWWLASSTPSLLATAASRESEYNAGWINWEPDLEPSGEFTPGEDAATFNELVSRAEAELDQTIRNPLYYEAETLLLKNAVYIPLGYWVQRFVQKPWLQGTRQGPWTGSTPLRIDEEVIVRGRQQG
jgi:oligopeptide transport system substrate-binding protein